MKKTILLMIIFLIYGCVSTPSFQQRLQYYVYKDEQVLINDIGLPTNTYISGNIKYLEFSVSSTGTRVTNNEYLRNNPYTCNEYYCPPPQTTVKNYTKWCTLLFAVGNLPERENVILQASYRGNACPR
tara:strand:+ start:439 stop:822 length:384 start_codon:yes stop_codon:yes gene_type:complete